MSVARKFDSTILDIHMGAELSRLCDFDEERRWTLMYRGTRDGFGSEHFHTSCDYQPNTLTVIRTNKKYIFGGFTAVPWSSEKGLVMLIITIDWLMYIFKYRKCIAESNEILMRLFHGIG